jgi:hypothetical protein
MLAIILSLFSSIRQGFRTQVALRAEILALRHQLLVLQRPTGIIGSVWVSPIGFCGFGFSKLLWNGWRPALVIVKPETVIAWHWAGRACGKESLFCSANQIA